MSSKKTGGWGGGGGTTRYAMGEIRRPCSCIVQKRGDRLKGCSRSYRFLLTGALGASWLFGDPEESVLKSSGDRQDSDRYRKR